MTTEVEPEPEAPLWYVLRHSGRIGDPWRVIFESRDEKQAEEFFWRKVPRDPNKAVCCTILTRGGTLWSNWVRLNGHLPNKAGLGLKGTVKATREREEREARKARRGQPRRRVVIPPEPVPAGLLAYEEFRRQHPAVRVEVDFYTHPMVVGEAFPNAKGATKRAYGFYLAQVRVEAVPVLQTIRIAPVEPEEAALDEAAAAEAEATAPRLRVMIE